jgi:beta-lactamase class A
LQPLLDSLMNSLSPARLSFALFLVCSLLIPHAGRADDLLMNSKIDSHIKSLRSRGVLRGDEKTAWIVYDFTAGREVASINGSSMLQAASMIKPFLALAFFHEVEAGRLSYTDTAKRHMELMIQKSNNDSTNWVMRQTGGPALTEAILKRNYPTLSQQMSIVEYIPEGGKTYRNQGSAGDYGRFLHELWYRRLPRADEMLRVMGLPGNDRLFTKVRSIPTGTRVYNKTGSTAMCCGDMGILVAKGRDGKSYPYAVIGIIESSRRNNSNYSSWISSRADVIRGVSNVVYLEMKKRYPL